MKEFVMNKIAPIVQTPKGKLRGFRYDGVNHFYGIRYAKAKRFQMPEPIAPWEGVKDAGSYGMICPVLSEPMPHRRGDDPSPVLAQLGALPVLKRVDGSVRPGGEEAGDVLDSRRRLCGGILH